MGIIAEGKKETMDGESVRARLNIERWICGVRVWISEEFQGQNGDNKKKFWYINSILIKLVLI